MPQIAIDLHSDALTRAFAGQVNLRTLKKGGIALQCLAAFVEGDAAAEYTAAASLFKKISKIGGFCAVKNYGGYLAAKGKNLISLALTAENIGFTGGDFESISKLKGDGVIMASLVWNNENSLAYPNVRPDNRRESRGLKERGRKALAALDEEGIIVDISHLSDGGAYEILRGRKLPAVASHSCADALFSHPRNLTDPLLRLIADCGGVVGVNFYDKFLGGRDMRSVAAHIAHIISVAGEDTPSFGSDWDGVPKGSSAICPQDMPRLLNFLCDFGISPRAVEKAACGNFLRVFKEVCG